MVAERSEKTVGVLCKNADFPGGSYQIYDDKLIKLYGLSEEEHFGEGVCKDLEKRVDEFINTYFAFNPKK